MFIPSVLLHVTDKKANINVDMVHVYMKSNYCFIYNVVYLHFMLQCAI